MTSLRAEFAAAQRRRGLLASSIERRDSALRLFEDWLDPRGIFDATPEDVDAFIDSRRNRSGGGPIGDRARYGYVSHFHMFYEWAIRHDLTDVDPTTRVDRPRQRLHLPRPIGEADLARAIDAARNDPTMRAWLTLMAFAGLRCAEVAGLDREDVMEHDDLLRIVGKGRKERLVPIHPRVTVALRMAGLPRSGPVFRRADGHRFEPGQVSRKVRSHLAGLGIEASAHQLRHRFGTLAYRSTRDLRTVAELMGHSSVVTTQGYVAWSRVDASAAVAGIPDPEAA